MFVVDFNPIVYHALQARGVKVHYGDICHADTLAHAGVADAEIVISSVPDSLLKGTSNERLVRHVRAVNPTAKIIATAEVLAQDADRSTRPAPTTSPSRGSTKPTS